MLICGVTLSLAFVGLYYYDVQQFNTEVQQRLEKTRGGLMQNLLRSDYPHTFFAVLPRRLDNHDEGPAPPEVLPWGGDFPTIGCYPFADHLKTNVDSPGKVSCSACSYPSASAAEVCLPP